ncbi:MAG: CCA tRNA nucleotidyltransferase [Eubacteriales bacterium]
MTRNIRIPKAIADILRRFDGAGIDAYCVGGCVRDALRGVVPHDWDLCTAAEPQTTRALFADQTCLETGIRHGTLTVLWDRMPVEITTYRVDGAYEGHRTPKQVTFSSSLREDCMRRDFTVNAMAYHPERGLFDFYGGREDLIEKRIRCVGDPEERFEEDALRMLRALRFSSVLDFSIEAETAAALHRKAPLLCGISGERIAAELQKLLCGVHAAELLWNYRDVCGVFLPVCARLSDGERLKVACSVLTEPEERFAALLYLCGLKNEEQVLSETACLPFSKAFAGNTAFLTGAAAAAVPGTRYDVRRCLALWGYDRFSAYLRLHSALFPEEADGCRQAEALLDAVRTSGDAVSLSMLAVNGSDLALYGLHGREIGSCLGWLLDEVMRDIVPNEREALLRAAERAFPLSPKDGRHGT